MELSNTYRARQKSMTGLGENLATLTRLISDYGNATVSKVITYFGVISVGGGTVQAVGKAVENPIIQECAKYAPDWLAWTPLIGVISLAVKNSCDVYYRRLEYKLKAKDNDSE